MNAAAPESPPRDIPLVYAALVLVVCSLPFVDLEVLRIAGKSIVLPYVTAYLLLIPLLRRRHLLAPVLTDPTLPYAAAWCAAAVISATIAIAAYAADPSLPWDRDDLVRQNVTQCVNVAMMIVQYALFICALRSLSSRQFASIIGWFVGIGTILAVYSLYQIGSVFYGWPLWDVFRTSNLYLKAPTLHPTGYGSWIAFPRAYGTAPEPSMWGGYLVITMTFVLGRIGHGAKTFERVALLLLLAGLLVTFSRSAWLSAGLAAGAATILRRTPRIRGSMVAATVGVLLGWTFLPALFVNPATPLGFSDLSALDRMSANMTGVNMFLAHPIFGIGPGSFKFLIDRYLFRMVGYNSVLFITVFNFILLVFVSTGVVGAAAFLAFVVSVLNRLRDAFRMTITDERLAAVRVGAALACLAVLFFWLNTPAYNFSLLWFCLAIASVAPEQLKRTASC